MATNKEKIMIYLDKETKKKFRNRAEKENRSMSNYIEMLIKKECEKEK